MSIRLRDLADAFAKSAEGQRAALAEAAPEVSVLAAGGARQGITDQTSPDGTPYPPLKFRRASGGNKRLLDKGLLRASVSAEVAGDELVLRANAPGARVHHYGATIRPVRGNFLVFRVGVGAPGARGRPRATRTVFARSVTVPGVHYLGVSAATAGRIGAALGRGFVRYLGRLLKG